MNNYSLLQKGVEARQRFGGMTPLFFRGGSPDYAEKAWSGGGMP